jgi:hypothetical protein
MTEQMRTPIWTRLRPLLHPHLRNSKRLSCHSERSEESPRGDFRLQAALRAVTCAVQRPVRYGQEKAPLASDRSGARIFSQPGDSLSRMPLFAALISSLESASYQREKSAGVNDMKNAPARIRHLFCAALVVVVSMTSAGCSWKFSESTKQMLASEAAARRITVTRESLPAGTYKVLGEVSVNTMPPPCRQEAVAEEALRRFGSKVDEVMNFGGGNPVGNGFYEACHGTAVQVIRKTPESSAKTPA